MRYFTAQLDENKVCKGVTDTPEPLIGPTFFAMESYDLTVLGKCWTGSACEEVEAP